MSRPDRWWWFFPEGARFFATICSAAGPVIAENVRADAAAEITAAHNAIVDGMNP